VTGGGFRYCGGMAIEKLKGVVSVASNSPGLPTGYSVQVSMLVERMKRHGLHVGVMSNFGTEGYIGKHRTKHGDIPVYPKGFKPYSDDVMNLWHEHHRRGHEDLPHFMMTLYDVWVYNDLETDIPIYSWVPLDHVTMPPLVKKFLQKENVTPIAMAPHGQRQLASAGFEADYIPHAVDTKVFKPTKLFRGVPTREFMGISKDKFLVTAVLANKANSIVHRKGFSELFLSFGIFHKDHPDSHLYIHADVLPAVGGFHLGTLMKSCGVPETAVTFANRDELRTGYSDEEMAAIYTASDVVWMATYGEGFGVPIIESAACGVRSIASDWAATADLMTPDSFPVVGQPFWDEPQKAFFQIPVLASLVEALDKAYNADRGTSTVAREFAMQFDVEKVWEGYWMPFLRKALSQ
jgi:glycosyltransferase involved in cell wall biosynthesis